MMGNGRRVLFWEDHQVLHLLQQKNSQRFGSGYHDYKVDDVKAQAPLKVGNRGLEGIYFILKWRS